MKFSGVMIGSEDSHALAGFYTKLLGEPAFVDGDWYGWSNGAQMMIGNHSDVHGKSATPQRLMLTFEVTDVMEAFEDLKVYGASVVAEPYQPDPERAEGLWLATFEDPDGNYVQINTPGME